MTPVDWMPQPDDDERIPSSPPGTQTQTQTPQSAADSLMEARVGALEDRVTMIEQSIIEVVEMIRALPQQAPGPQ